MSLGKEIFRKIQSVGSIQPFSASLCKAEVLLFPRNLEITNAKRSQNVFLFPMSSCKLEKYIYNLIK